jgi:hypothetical protein
MSEEIFEQSMSGELASFESALRRLSPATARIDRDQLMFRAGCASAARSKRIPRWLWPAATAAMTLVSATLAVLLAQGDREPPGRGQRPVDVATTPASPRAPSSDDAEQTVEYPPLSQVAYFSLRETVLDRGVDAIPGPMSEANSGHVGTERFIDLRRRLLDASDEMLIDSSHEAGERS